MQLSIEIDMTAERAQKAVGMMRSVKKFYEETADKRVKAGALTAAQAQEKLFPLADALMIVGLVELEVTAAREPGLDDVREYEALESLPDAGPGVKGAGVKNVAAENEAECGDCRVPRCRFCGQPGKRAGGVKNAEGKFTERYYLCETAGCLAAKMRTPQPLGLFAGGK